MVGSTISNPRRPGPLTTNLRCNQLSSRADVSSLKYRARTSQAESAGGLRVGRKF